MKDRFSTLDISVQCKELKFLEGLRLTNVYELGPKTFLFKVGDQMVILESGVRIHTTKYSREYSNLGGFCTKLRKYLKNKRLNSIRQLGGDRRICLVFGEGEYAFNLVVEFYAQGNIILTDNKFKVVCFLRLHDGIQVGMEYELPENHPLPVITKDQIVQGFEMVLKDWETRKKKNLKSALRSIFGKTYGPSLCDYALQIAGLNNDVIENLVNPESIEFKTLFDAMQECDALIRECIEAPGGFIKIVQHQDYQEYTEFQPFKPLDGEILEFDSFNIAVDAYFTHSETQKSQDKIRNAENQALKKLESVKLNSENQVKGYQISRQEKELMAKTIEDNVDLVNACCQTICSLVAGGMHWNDIQDVVDQEKGRGNQVAKSIKKLTLEKGKVTLVLPLASDGYDSEGSNKSSQDTVQQFIDVDVDIYQSAYSNARSFYSEKKVAAVKEIKSQNASKKAIMVAEKKIMEKLAKRTGSVPTITKARVPAWYEQFMWFITTENCLVIGSRDPIQCEQLLIKYFRDGDTLLTCDMDGSAICIVKKGDGLVGNATMLQAATMVVCSSKAWENKIVTSAYHLAFHQVSKIAHGQILPPGKFDIKGEKNWLPPVQTSYGIGLLWVIDDDSKTRHYDDRRPWLRGEIAGDVVPNQNEDDENESDKGGSSDQDVRSKDDDADGAESVEIETVHQIAQEEAVERTESPTDLKHDDGEAQEADHEDSKLNDNENEEMTIDASVSVVSNNEAAQDSEKGKKGGKLSAKQRKLLKKGKSIDEPSINQTQKVEVKPKETLKEAPAKLPRGQKNKMKKIKDKYGFQDEEEKFEKQIKANAKLEVLKEKIEEKNKPKPLNTEQRQKKDPFKVLEKGKSFEVPDVDVENLVGCPMEGDVLLACIPVSAPWLALQKFKYKIKVMPGSLKRGKACQQAQNAFSVMAKKRFSSEIESELMEHVPAKDWNDAMMSKAKLVISEKK